MRNFTSSINDVHSKLNKSMNKVSSGKAYESAAENPLAYYEGQKIDHQYQDTLSKLSLTTSIKKPPLSAGTWSPFHPGNLIQR